MVLFNKSSYDNVFKDLRRPFNCRYLDDYNLVMARNEYQSYQICLRNEDPFTIKSVTFGDFLDVSGNIVISSENVRYNFVEYVYVPTNTGGAKELGLLRPAPDWFPDPLSNNRSIKVDAKSTQPIWITVYVPMGTPAGKYKCSILISTSDGDFSPSINLEVCAVTIPETNVAELKYMHHQQITGPWWLYSRADYHPHDPIKVCYGYERWTPEWWKLVGDIAKKMKEHRQNVLYVNTPSLLLDGGTIIDENGKFTFNWSRFDEYIQFFIDAGVVKGLEGTHLSTIDYMDFTFQTYTLGMGSEGMEIQSPYYNTKETQNWLDQFLPALINHLDEKGWTDIWFQHVGDEVLNEPQITQYIYYIKELLKYNPKFLIGDPHLGEEYSKKCVELGCNVCIPILDLYENCRKTFDKMVDDGVSVYVYNCCGPGGLWLNRFVDKPVWHMRTLGWLIYSWGIKGYLHWGFNFWNDWTMDEYLEISEEEARGDHYTIYPDYYRPDMVRSSIRYEANRDAAQDFELLTILGRKDPEKAKTLVAAIGKNSKDDYTHDTVLMKAKHDELVREAAKIADEK